MEDLEAYQDKFSESGKRILEFALTNARKRQQHFISPEHILYALIIEESELFESTMKRNSIDSETVRLAIEKRLENSPIHNGFGFRIAPDTTEIFKFSMDRARSQGRRIIDSEDIISVFLTVKKDLFDDILQNSESLNELFKRNRINPNFLRNPQSPKSQEQIKFEAKQLEGWQQFHEEQKKFLSKFSLEELVKNNRFLLNLTALGRVGDSGGGGGIIGDEIRYTQHSSLSFSYKLENEVGFKQDEIIASLKKDVENCLKQNLLKITKSDFSSSSSFLVEYEGESLTGQIKIAVKITRDYYQLSVNQNEMSIRKK